MFIAKVEGVIFLERIPCRLIKTKHECCPALVLWKLIRKPFLEVLFFSMSAKHIYCYGAKGKKYYHEVVVLYM